MAHATVFVIMDAGRSDYVRWETMPFLHGLSRSSVTGSFESPPGFAQRTVLFSGRYPDTSGNFSQFVFDPESSPFGWVRRLGPLRSLVQPRRLLFPLRMAIQKVTQWTTGAYHTDPAWIPPKFMPYFAMCEDTKPMYDPGALGAPSLFDLCREHGLTFRYLAHPVSGDDDEVHRLLLADLAAKAPYDLYVAQFSVTDERGHQDGPFSDAMQTGHLRRLDTRFQEIHAALSANYDSWDLVVCGDHGMAPVERRIDVLALLRRKCSARPAKDYVVFINSTLAVFWYLTERGRTEVEAFLRSVPGSHLVDEEERRRRRIPLDRKWGDRMLAAEPGVMYWPDYFHVQDSTIVGMHGYLDKRTESHGAMVIASSPDRAPPPARLGLRPLVDVFPTLCEMLELPIPATSEGRSLWPTCSPTDAVLAPRAVARPSPMSIPRPPLASIYLNHQRVGLLGDPRPPVSKVLSASGTPTTARVLRARSPEADDGDAISPDTVLDRTARPDQPVYLVLARDASQPPNGPDGPGAAPRTHEVAFPNPGSPLPRLRGIAGRRDPESRAPLSSSSGFAARPRLRRV